ncbi:MAG: efflux RND transporter permease subunit [Gemmataceae bacterium]|nr:efflux RND transporter permease subunit [Gemmataceae bacterium]MCI0741839.1 efflux RND transporter permease subunit [Gemmataceae bacterium]
MSDLSIKNPVFAVMLSAAMIVFGYLGYREMGVSQFPEIDFPVVSVQIVREGAPPDIMDGDVTDVVEDAVSGVEGVHYVMSRSLESNSMVTVFFHLSRNIDAAMQDVQNAVSAARRRLPLDIDPPVISKVNPNNLPVMWLTLSASSQPGVRPMPLREISDFAEKEFKQQIAAIPEVGGIQFGGLQSRNIRIHHDAFKLGSYNLSAEDLAQAIQKQHSEMPAGYIQSRLTEANLRTMGEAYSIKELNRLLIAQKSNQQIQLKDVAVSEDGSEDRRTFARYTRMPAVAIGVRKAIGGNLVAVCENVKKELPRLQRMLPEGVELNLPVDYSVFIRENIEELKFTLFLGIVLTAGVCFLFLGSLGTTINICLSIPVSLVGTFFVLRYGVQLFGMEPFTINLMTLLGLSLSVGVVVDDAILVLENIYRHREMGKPKREAALLGAREITFAAIAATLSIMAIFLPVAFMKGTIGKFFFQFGVTVGVAVFFSLLSALTLTPMLCAFFLNLHKRKPPRPKFFGWSLAVVAGGFVLVVGSALRVVALWVPELRPWGWWPATLTDSVWGGALPAMGQLQTLPWWWIGVSALEFGIGFLLVRFGNLVYWLLLRFILEPLLLHPTEWVLRKTTAGYARLLAWSLSYKSAVLIPSAGLIALAFLFIYFNVLGMELVPTEDQSRFVARIIAPVGSSIDYIDDRLQHCERKLQSRPDVASFLTTVAAEPGQLINEADIFVQLTPRHERKLTQHEIMAQVRADLEKVADIRVVLRDQSTEGFTAQRGDPVDFAIQGDWDRLPRFSHEVMDEMAKSGKYQDIDSDYRPGMPEVRIMPSRDKLALVNMTMAHLANSLSLHVGGQRIAKYTEGGRRYDIRMRLQLPQRASPSQLESILLRAGDNRLVPLGDVANIEMVSTLPIINRYNHQRKVQISASPAPGVSQGEAIAYFDVIVDKAKKTLEARGWNRGEVSSEREAASGHGESARDFTITELGNAQAMRETINSLVFALVLGIIIAYMILGVQFNSFVHPLTVLLAMPFAVTGALVTLWLTGGTLNMMSMIGLILLMGLVKKNSIILVDYTNQLRDEGLSVREAVLKACPIRLRPILMTSIATVAGALPAAIGLGPGAETRAPMARAIIGGIVLSTLVTLFLVPVFYVLVEHMRGWSRRLWSPPEEPSREPAQIVVH